MFLIGLYVGRRRIISDMTGHLQLIRRVFRWGLPIGLISMTAERILNATTGYTVFREQQAGLLPQLPGDVIFTFGSTALALAYAAGITLLAQSVRGRQLLTPLGAAGRMALTVYISSSIMFGTLYYGFTFGNAFLLGPAAAAGYAVLFDACSPITAPVLAPAMTPESLLESSGATPKRAFNSLLKPLFTIATDSNLGIEGKH